MIKVASSLIACLAAWIRSFSLTRKTALVVGYAVALIAEHALGRGGGGQELLALAAPLAVGMIIRFGGRLRISDLPQFFAVQAALGLAFARPLAPTLVEAAQDGLMIAAAVAVFAQFRAWGFMRSPVRLMGATAAVSLAAPLSVLPLEAIAMLSHGAIAPTALASAWLTDCVSLALGLAAALSFGRDCSPIAREQSRAGEAPPRRWEYVAAAAVIVGLTALSIDGGRPEALLAASVVLLWFALRLGLFPTTLAALLFAVGMTQLGAAGRWALVLSVPDPEQAQALRYLAVGLLTAPAIVVATVVHDQMRLKHMFAYRALHDGLTTLANRSRFLEVLDAAATAARVGNHRFLLLLIDLDHFKSVNDTYGHARGDRLLIEVSNRLRQNVRATDIVARLGGDEFAVVAPVPNIDDAIRLTKRIVEGVNQDCDLDGVTVRPSVTVGGVLSPDSATDPQHLMLLADEAMYKAKAAGRNGWRFASAEREPVPAPAFRLGDREASVETVFLD